MRSARALYPAILAGLLAGPTAISAQEVGTAGAVNPASTGTPPAKPTRVLQLGSRIIHRERISTAAGGNVQLVFLDKTTMSIGPNSEVTIDEFVYDPNAGTGRMAVSMAKGVLRFVGGNTSHSGGAEVKTPAATLGIRGGVATIEHRPCTPGASADSCGTKAINHFGILSVTTAAGTEVIRRPGFAVTVAGAGAPPSAPRKVTQAEVNETNRAVSSKAGQSGGTASRITGAIVARADTVGPVLAQIGTAVISQQSQTVARGQTRAETLGLTRAPTDATSPTQIQQSVTDLRQSATTQIQQVVAENINAENPITRPPTGGGGGGGGVPASAQAFALKVGGTGPGATVPYLPAGFAGRGTLPNTAALGYADGGTTTSGSANTSARVLQAGVAIDGQGTGQTSSIYVLVGQSSIGSSGSPQFAGGFTATSRNGTGLPGRASSGAVGVSSDVALDSGYAPTGLTARPGTVTNGVVTPESATYARHDGAANADYAFTLNATRAATPTGLGANRPAIDTGPNTNYGGIAGGLVTSVNRNTNAVIASSAPFQGVFDIGFDPKSSRFGTTILGSTTTSPTTPADAFQSGSLTYGSQGSGSQDGRGTYVDYENFGAREARSTGANGAFLASVNGADVSEHRGLFVTSKTVDAQASFPNVAFCQCEYTRWGFWSSETTRTSNGRNVQDLLHLGTWVFGPVAEFRDIPTTGVATYSGHAIGTFNSGGGEYVAAGAFQNAVNFGNRTGTVAITNLDGRSYGGSVSLATGQNSFAGTLSTTAGASAAMSLQGQFSRGLTGPAGEMAGGLTVTGTNYIGSGVFAGAAAAPR